MNREYEFYAFISYERGEEDEKWARRLQRELERYRIPVAGLMGVKAAESDGPGGENFPSRLRVFRDKSDLGARSTAGQGLSENLDASRFLIVVCSRRSAVSPCVDAEVRRFVESGRGENIIPFFIDDSEPEQSRDPRQFPRPPSLQTEMEGVSASEGREESFVHLLARLLLVEQEGLMQAHLRASGRRAAHRFFAVAASVILIAVLGLWALAAESRATTWRRESEELVDFLTFDLDQETSGVVSSATRSAITEKVNAYYERWEPGEPRTLYSRAINLDNRGLEMFLAHDTAGAAENYLAALTAIEGLRNKEPENERYFAGYSKTLCHLGDARAMDGRVREAAELYEQSARAAETFQAARPDSLEASWRLAESMERVAILGAKIGYYEEAANVYKRCGEIWDDMRASWPEETGTQVWRLKYGGYLSNRGYYAYELRGEEKDFGPAMEYMLNALSVFEGLRGEAPENFMFRLMCANQITRITSVAIKTRSYESAEAYYSSGEELWRKLVSDDESNSLYSYGWAGMLMEGALLRAGQGRRSEAEALLDRADEAIGELLRKLPGDETFLARKSLIEEYRAHGVKEPK